MSTELLGRAPKSLAFLALVSPLILVEPIDVGRVLTRYFLKVTITIEIDAELLAQVTEVLKPYGLTPEEAAVQFFEYCADPKTQDHAITLLKRWKEEQEAQERNSTNAK